MQTHFWVSKIQPQQDLLCTVGTVSCSTRICLKKRSRPSFPKKARYSTLKDTIEATFRTRFVPSITTVLQEIALCEVWRTIWTQCLGVSKGTKWSPVSEVSLPQQRPLRSQASSWHLSVASKNKETFMMALAQALWRCAGSWMRQYWTAPSSSGKISIASRAS